MHKFVDYMTQKGARDSSLLQQNEGVNTVMKPLTVSLLIDCIHIKSFRDPVQIFYLIFIFTHIFCFYFHYSLLICNFPVFHCHCCYLILSQVGVDILGKMLRKYST